MEAPAILGGGAAGSTHPSLSTRLVHLLARPARGEHAVACGKLPGWVSCRCSLAPDAHWSQCHQIATALRLHRR